MLGSLDFGLSDNYDCWSLAEAGLIMTHPLLTDLTLINADLVGASCVHVQTGTPLQALTLIDCEIDTHWLEVLATSARCLTSFRATKTNAIWNGWRNRARTEGKGRWIDVLQALESQQENPIVVDVTSGYQHTIIPELEQTLDFRPFTALRRLAADSRSTVIVSELVECSTVDHVGARPARPRGRSATWSEVSEDYY